MTFSERRAHLAQLLRNHPNPASFDMRGWSTCTSAVACTDPTFNALGLHILSADNWTPVFEDFHSFGALFIFFGYQGFGDPAFQEVFCPTGNAYATRLQIARRLEAQL